jgi:hypothetical protein
MAELTPTAAVIGYESAGCIFALWRNITIAIWATQATVELVAELTRFSEEISVQLNQQKVSALHIIRNQARLPDVAARQALRALNEQYAPRIACTVTMIEGTGFWASAMRGLVTGLQLVAPRQQYKHHSCATTSEAAGWLVAPHARQTGVHIDSGELRGAVDLLLARPSVRVSPD